MDMITLIVGGACLLYYALIAVYAGADVNFGWFWIALGCAFLVVHFASRSPVRVIRIGAGALLCILAAGLLILAVQSAQVIAGMSQKDTGGTDYVIVLGAEVKGTRPSRSLLMRLQKAEEYAKENPDTTLILSGGQGSGEDISEAQCMYEYLTTRGIPGERLILEDRSTNTRENLRFSDELTGCSTSRCGILSNSFHICRALLLARKAGYSDPVGIPARSDPVLQVHLVVREAAALTVGKLRGEF